MIPARAIRIEELSELLRLYGYLNPDDPKMDAASPAVFGHWRSIFDHPLFHYYVVEKDGKLLSTCTLSIIPNMTRGLRPYGLIENVVTDPDYRKQGHGRTVLQYAVSEAWEAGCYKVMLQCGRKDPGTLDFYGKAGFKLGTKTAFEVRRP